jgi:hypothetical protein
VGGGERDATWNLRPNFNITENIAIFGVTPSHFSVISFLFDAVRSVTEEHHNGAIMKVNQIIISILSTTLCNAVTVAAFLSSSPLTKRTSRCFHLQGTQLPDASDDAIAEATKITEELGTTLSTEAQGMNESLLVGVDVFSLSEDYATKIRSLHYLMEDTNWSMQQMKRLIKEIKALELKDPSLARLPDGPDGAALKTALSTAKTAMEVHGATSVEAAKAWDRLDSCFFTNDNNSNADGTIEISDECDIDSDEPSSISYRYSAAALKAHHMYNAAIDVELLDEALDALGRLKGLTKFVNIEKRRLDAQ